LPAGWEWRKPGDFFTEKLVLIQQAQAFPGSVALTGQETLGNNVTALLPLKEELLSYVTPEHLRETVRFERAGQDYKVSLKLRLSGGELKISRTYQDADILRNVKLPVLEVWPNFRSERWKVYFTYWDQGDSEDAFKAEPFVPGTDGRVGETTEQHLEVTELSFAPEFFVCSYLGSPVGVLPVALDKLLPGPPSEFRVGVDFGTTNSHVYLHQTGVDAPQPLVLEGGTFAVTSSDVGARAERLYGRFLPPVSTDTPILSFFRRRPVATYVRPIPPLRNGHILFYRGPSGHAELNSPLIHARLKWTSGSEDMAEAYLKQLALHASAEAFRQGATGLSWYYSLPSAFSLHTRNQFEVLWNRIQDHVHQVTGLPCAGPTRLTESVAAARYFTAQENAHPQTGAVFVDIGGGTSDVSLWQRQQLRLQCSVLLSGREMFLEPMFAMRKDLVPGLLNGLGIPDDLVKELERTGSFQRFCAHFDGLLRFRETENRIVQGLLNVSTQVAPLVSLIGLGLCGLFYYVGLMIHSARRAGSYSDFMDGVACIPGIFLGGNGCKLLHWVSNSQWLPGSPVNALLRQVLLAAAGLPGPAEPRIEINTVAPKCEAAYGLIHPSDFARESFNSQDLRPFTSVVAGEPFTIDGQMDELAELTGDHLKAGVRVGRLVSLRHFVSLYAQAVQGPNAALPAVPQVDKLLDETEADVINWAASQRGRDPKHIDVQPLFVVGLQSLLKRATRAQVERQHAAGSGGA